MAQFRLVHTGPRGEAHECIVCNHVVYGYDAMIDHRCPEVSSVGVYEDFCPKCDAPKRWRDEPCDRCGHDPSKEQSPVIEEQGDATNGNESKETKSSDDPNERLGNEPDEWYRDTGTSGAG